MSYGFHLDVFGRVCGVYGRFSGISGTIGEFI